MPDYRRNRIPGGTYFFTVNLLERNSGLLVTQVALLREAVRQLRGGLGKRQVAGAEIALVHNEGGILSSHCTLILGNKPN